MTVAAAMGQVAAEALDSLPECHLSRRDAIVEMSEVKKEGIVRYLGKNVQSAQSVPYSQLVPIEPGAPSWQNPLPA